MVHFREQIFELPSFSRMLVYPGTNAGKCVEVENVTHLSTGLVFGFISIQGYTFDSFTCPVLNNLFILQGTLLLELLYALRNACQGILGKIVRPGV